MSDSETYNLTDESEKIFTVTNQKQNDYVDKVKQYLDTYYWKYDDSSISYSEKILVDDDEFKKICDASKQIDLDLSKYRGNTVIEVQTNLLYFNSEIAGNAHFYFYKDEIIGIYYNTNLNKNLIFSLKDRNIFIVENSFDKYENREITKEFKEPMNIKALKNGFCSIDVDSNNDTIVAYIEDSKVNFYKYKNSNFYYDSSLDFSSLNLLPVDVLFFKDGDKLQYGILLSNITAMDEKNEFTITESKKVVFYGENMLKLPEEIELEKTNYLSMGYDDGSIVLFQNNNMEYYKKIDTTWQKHKQITLESEVQSFIKSDIDRNGTYEYVMMDGKDIYIYNKQGDIFKTIWKTHISVENLKGDLFTADLNNDGIKEIYILDNTGTTIRYILAEKGFISDNGDIMYGEQIYPGDFDNDGIDDYIKLQMQDNVVQQLYIYKKGI